MTYGTISETVESYINGNISTAKATVKRMSKADFAEFIEYLAQYYNTMGDSGYSQALDDAARLVR
jgi:hypothetical protein